MGNRKYIDGHAVNAQPDRRCVRRFSDKVGEYMGPLTGLGTGFGTEVLYASRRSSFLL